MMRTRLSRLAGATLTAAALAAALAACGGSSGKSSSTGSPTTGPALSPAPAASTPSPATTSTSVASTTSAASTGCPAGVTTCISTDPSTPVSGPRPLTANLIALMRTSQPYLKQVKLDCPSANATAFPIQCKLQTFDTEQGHVGVMVGTLTVRGIYTGTHSYTYELLYGPAKTSSTGPGTTGTTGAPTGGV